MSKEEHSDERVAVYVRIRPFLAGEPVEEPCVIKGEDEDMQRVIVRKGEDSYELPATGVFSSDVGQDVVFQRLGSMVDDVSRGVNACVFAYGQTGSGKTHTMFGPNGSMGDGKEAGLVPRMLRRLFSRISKEDADSAVGLSTHVSFAQLYCERVYDLLAPDLDPTPLRIHDSKESGVFVEGLSEFAVPSVDAALRLVRRGEAQRAVRSTRRNMASSRSHCVLTVTVERQEMVPGAGTVVGRLCLVDLAGSERWDGGIEAGGAHAAELRAINASLHTLGRCVFALASRKKRHVPYRDSKLTTLLKDVLGGNSRTASICCVAPSQKQAAETHNTLAFADAAKRILTHARVNRAVMGDRALVQHLRAENARLRAENERLRQGGKAEPSSSSPTPPTKQEGPPTIPQNSGGAVEAFRTLERSVQLFLELLLEESDLRVALDAARGKLEQHKTDHTTVQRTPIRKERQAGASVDQITQELTTRIPSAPVGGVHTRRPDIGGRRVVASRGASSHPTKAWTETSQSQDDDETQELEVLVRTKSGRTKKPKKESKRSKTAEQKEAESTVETSQKLRQWLEEKERRRQMLEAQVDRLEEEARKEEQRREKQRKRRDKRIKRKLALFRAEKERQRRREEEEQLQQQRQLELEQKRLQEQEEQLYDSEPDEYDDLNPADSREDEQEQDSIHGWTPKDEPPLRSIPYIPKTLPPVPSRPPPNQSSVRQSLTLAKSLYGEPGKSRTKPSKPPSPPLPQVETEATYIRSAAKQDHTSSEHELATIAKAESTQNEQQHHPLAKKYGAQSVEQLLAAVDLEVIDGKPAPKPSSPLRTNFFEAKDFLFPVDEI